jgi:hypothetical protein
MTLNGNWLNVAEIGSLQAAFDRLPPTGGTIYLPAGVYPIGDSVVARLAEGQHLNLIGEGRGSVLVNECSDGCPLLHLTGVVGSWWPNLRLTIRDISFVGSHRSGDGLVVDYPNDALIDTCFFEGHGAHALRLGPQGTNVTVRDCWLRDCRRGIRADNIHHLTLHGNQTRSRRDGQIQAEHLFLGWECREVRVVNNHFAYGHAQGIILDGTAQHVISGNTIEGFPIGIEAHGRGETQPPDRCRDIIISNNYLHADCGIWLQGECRGFTVSANSFVNNPEAAVRITEGQGAGGHNLTGNMVRKSVYDGQYVKTASERQGGFELGEAEGCVVQGNLLEGVNPGPGVSAAAGGRGHLIANNLCRGLAGRPGLQIEASDCLVSNNLES